MNDLPPNRIPRGKLVTAKILAAVVNCIGLTLITWGMTLFAASSYEPEPEFFEFVSLGVLALFIIQMIFLAVGIFYGCALKRYKIASSAAVSTLLVTYFLSIISGLKEEYEFMKYISPFKYFDPGLILRESRFEMVYVWISLGIIIVCVVGAYVSYSRRDLYI